MSLHWDRPWPDIRAWVADAGHLRIVIVGSADAVNANVMLYGWEIGRKGRREADIIGSHIICAENCLSLEEAQNASAAAVVALLVESFATIASDDPLHLEAFIREAMTRSVVRLKGGES